MMVASFKDADPLLRTASTAVHDPAQRAHLFNAFPSFVWCADANGGCSFVNQRWTDYTGRALVHQIGDGWLECVHEEDRPRVARAWREALGLRQAIEVEYRLLRSDGEAGWVQHCAVPIEDGHGRLNGYLGSCHDITPQRTAELTALARERQIRMLAEHVPVLIAYYAAAELRCRFANKAYAQKWGWDERSIVGRTAREVIGDAGYREIEPHLARVREGEEVTYERRVRAADGSERVLEVSLLPQRASETGAHAVCVMIHDITRHRLDEEALRRSEERLRMFTRAAKAGIVFHDDGIVTDCNEAFLRITGRDHAGTVGSAFLDHVSPECRRETEASLASGDDQPFESEIVAADGTRTPVEMDARLLAFDGKTFRLTIVRDIRKRRESEQRIDYLAHHDVLTGLPNRVLLHDRLEFILATARRHGTSAALLFIDLDDFKTVNDSLGHPAGDKLLKAVAARIAQCLRSVDVVARHGGDEFIVVLPETDREGAIHVADKLLAAIGEPVALEGESVAVSPSIGIAIFGSDGAGADDLIKNADAAMYLAKARGRANYQFFNQALAASATRALSLEKRIREALREGAFTLHYQPQVRADTGAVVGLEALMRWPQPGGAFIEPNEFIPLAEKRGLIRPLGSWALREACRQNRAWQLAGLPAVPVAVNLSALQFRQKDLLAEVKAVLGETGLDPTHLTLELTESMLMEDGAEIVRTLEGFKALGVKLAIDDFGTGHSSLMSLKRFPIDYLKIDRTFVRDTPDDEDDVAITGAVIDLARNLGLITIAEGVDRVATLEFLRSRGCDQIQGFLFGEAMAPERVAEWLARSHASRAV